MFATRLILLLFGFEPLFSIIPVYWKSHSFIEFFSGLDWFITDEHWYNRENIFTWATRAVSVKQILLNRLQPATTACNTSL